jgi:hypothetical protein
MFAKAYGRASRRPATPRDPSEIGQHDGRRVVATQAIWIVQGRYDAIVAGAERCEGDSRYLSHRSRDRHRRTGDHSHSLHQNWRGHVQQHLV